MLKWPWVRRITWEREKALREAGDHLIYVQQAEIARLKSELGRVFRAPRRCATCGRWMAADKPHNLEAHRGKEL